MSQPAPEPDRNHAGVVVPPPLIYAGALALALGLDYALGGPSLALGWALRGAIGGALILAGLAIPMIALAQFRHADTDVRPWKPSSALVTTGLYRYTRNPMYLGMSLIYAGFAVFADSVAALAFLPALLVLITYAVIKREEHYLEITFGEAYRAYKRKVRRWV
jgi:protein-S-isoprenylcysteine O-methyltransferase Ste14